MAIAKKATLIDAHVKIMVWGDPGCGKSRFGLSAPSPLVIDYEGSTRLYANEFDFLFANVDRTNDFMNTPVKLTSNILKEIIAGEYKEAKTLVIDPVTDLLDNLEALCATEYEKKINKSVSALSAIDKTKWYAFRRDTSRNLLNQLKDLPLNLILVARSKNVWGKDTDGKMAPIGQTYDALEIVESLMDVVIHLQKNKQDDVQAIVKKSRLGNLPDVLPVKDYGSIIEAITESNKVEKVISPAQVKDLWTLATGAGFKKEDIYLWIENEFKKTSTRKLTEEEYKFICTEITEKKKAIDTAADQKAS